MENYLSKKVIYIGIKSNHKMTIKDIQFSSSPQIYVFNPILNRVHLQPVLQGWRHIWLKISHEQQII